MIIIRVQIWFLIKFKLQKKEWIWLKLGFSHAKGLWHYKYRSQGMKEDTQKKPQEKAITRNLQKNKKDIYKKRGWGRVPD